jgi:hypothetical protein
MPGHESAKTKVVVDIFVAIDVVNPAAPSVFHENGVGLVVAVIASDSQRDALQGPLVRFGGLWCPVLVCGDFLL